MQRLIFLFVLLCFALAVAGQNVTIQKSADVVVNPGKELLFAYCAARPDFVFVV